MRRSQAVVLVLTAAGGALALVAGGRTWVTVAAAAALPGGVTAARAYAIHGSDLTGVLSPLALVSLAGGAALLATRGWARLAVGILLGVVGAGVGLAVLHVVAAPRRPAELAVQALGGAVGLARIDRHVWAGVGLLPPLLVLAAGVATVVFGRSWSSLSGRYEREGAATVAARRAQQDPDGAAWAALDRGEDPTAV